MKFIPLLLVVSLLFLAGCQYDAPLSKEHSIAVDPSVLGLWKPVPQGDKKSAENVRMLVLKYSETEYLIHYLEGTDGLYFRGYAIKIADVPCFQLQAIGTDKDPVKEGDGRLFAVMSYQLNNGTLEVKALNTKLVEDDLKDTEALRGAFLKHKDDKDLFREPKSFRK